MNRKPPPADGRPPAPAGAAPSDVLPALFCELAAGRAAALEGIYDEMGRELYGLAIWRTGSPADAEDAVQSVFVKLAGFDGRRLAAVRDPRSYLLAMVHRACVDLRRAPAARAMAPLEEATFVRAAHDDPQRRLDARRISAKLNELPAPQREAIFLHHFSDMTFAAIGRVTGVPTFTAASRFRNGIRALRRLMGLPK